MYWTKFSKSSCTLFYSMSCVTIIALALWFGAPTNSVKASSDKATPEGGSTFPGMGTGNIPDGDGTCAPPSSNLDITFDVMGISNIDTVEVDMTATHSWVGDVSATLIAPSGESHILFQSTGWTDASSCFGDSSDLGGTYNFSDTATTNWWSEADLRDGSTDLTPGDYRTTEPGGDTQTMDPAPVTSMDPVFQPTTTINGTWTLRVSDWAGGDTGAVSAANLSFNTNVVVAQPPQNDFDGDGVSDYSIVRNDTPPFSGTPNPPRARRSIEEQIADPGFKPLNPTSTGDTPENHGTNLSWFIHESATNTARVQGFGEPTTDFWIPEDFDGDGQDDLAVWRGVAASGPMGGFFYTFTSSDSTVNEIDFGQTGDNPTVTGDYDGDGSADPAVFRCPVSPPGGQCTFFYQGSAGGGEITFFDWGNNSSNNVRPYPGDFDGDGSYDFCTFENGLYSLFRSSDSGTEFIQWGLATDPVLAPGDYDGDGQTDFMNVRANGSQVEWWLLDRTGGQNTILWGALIAGFTEFVAQGDFDGDNTTDVTVWRRDNSSDSNSFFYTLRSSDLMLQTFEWGSMNDAPVPGWQAN